ncbi:MAG: hypothetical protein NZ555_06190 [Geminicoccaceae bacterium]|nr:hypothetical protein [Geminicoccaceae bacterium]
MTPVDDSPEREPVPTVPGKIVFDRMAATLLRSARGQRRYALVLVFGGTALVLAGLWVGTFVLLAPGAVAMAVAILPWLRGRELSDRAEGMVVLGEDWAEPGPSDVVARRRAGLIDLVERLYAPSGSR